jgi:tetratricopeptide (TPR) repeat protein
MRNEQARSDPDDVLTRVVEVMEQRDFFHLTLVNDAFDDWNLAKDLGSFLIRIVPQEAVGYALLARAYRHLGEPKRALESLEQCRIRISPDKSGNMEAEYFSSFFAVEEKQLGVDLG